MAGFRRRSALTGSAHSASLSQWTQPGFVKSIQRNTITITGATSNTRTITAVDIGNSELHFLGQTYSNFAANANQAIARLAFTNGTTITATVGASPGADTLVVSFEVIEYYPGIIKSVQRNTLTAGTSTINPVNILKAHVDYLGVSATGGGAPGVGIEGTLVLTNTTTVTFAVGVAATQTASYQVVEFY